MEEVGGGSGDPKPRRAPAQEALEPVPRIWARPPDPAAMIREEFTGGKPWAKYYAHGGPFPLAPSWIESRLEQEGVFSTARCMDSESFEQPCFA